MRYLLKAVDTYRVPDEAAVEALHEELLNDPCFDLVGFSYKVKQIKAKGEVVEDESNDGKKNDKPLISVSTHIDDNYVSDGELKIAIHKKINEVNSYDSFCNVKEELEDRFGKLNDDLIIYMYEEWFEKLAKSLNVLEVIDGKNSVDMTLSKEMSAKIDGETLFNEAYSVSRMFRFSYSGECIHVILDKIKLDKHYLMYLTGILIKIKNMLK